MKDFNFFSSFDKERMQQKSKTRRDKSIIIGVILVFVLFYGSFGARIFYNVMRTNSGEAFLNSPEVKAKLVEIEDKKTATENLKTYIAGVNNAKQKIALGNRVSSVFLDTVQKAIPTSVVIRSLEIEDYQLKLSGNAPLTLTAELVHNLEQTGLFSRVHVESINSDTNTGNMQFEVVCDVKEVTAQ